MHRGCLLILLMTLMSIGLGAFEPQFASQPAISPDGNMVCFVYQNDLWLVPFKGGAARRLTSTSASESRPLWSPDGKQIAYLSSREGQSFIYTISSNGGSAQTVIRESYSISDWFADGTALLGSRWNYQYGSSFYRIPLDGTRPQLITEVGDGLASLSPSNDKIIFNRRGNAYREAYTGSVNGDLWEIDIKSKKYTRLTNTNYTERYPRYSQNSGSIFFAASDGLRFQLFRVDDYNFDKPVKLTDFDTWSVRNINNARKNDKVVFECFNEIWKYDPTTIFSSKVSKLEITIPEDNWEDPLRLASMLNEFGTYGISGDELITLYQYKYDLFAIPRKGGEVKQLSSDHAGVEQIGFLNDNRTAIAIRMQKGTNSLFKVAIDSTFSSTPVEWFGKEKYHVSEIKKQTNGSWVINFTDEKMAGRIAVADTTFSNIRQIDLGNIYAYNFTLSPEGDYALYSSIRDYDSIREIYLYDFINEENTKIMNVNNSVGGFTWTPDLKSALVTLGGGLHRLDFLPRDEFELETDNWKEILEKKPDQPEKEPPDSKPEDEKQPETPDEPKEEEKVDPNPDELENPEEIMLKAPGKPVKPIFEIQLRDIEKRMYPIILAGGTWIKPVKMITDTTFYFTQESYFDEGVSYLKKANIHGKNIKEDFNFGKNCWNFQLVGDNMYYLSNNALKSYHLTSSRKGDYSNQFDYQFDLNTLNKRVFEQVWAAFGLNFYDPNMHGLSWQKVYDLYRPYVDKAVSIQDLAKIIDEMIGDVNASHTGFYPRRENNRRYKPTASLGLDFDFSSVLEEGLIISQVYPRHRLYDFYKVRPGALLTHIDGMLITSKTPIDSLLADKIDKRIRLKIMQDGEMIDATITGISLWEQRELWYQKRTEDTRKLVGVLSSGRLGYVHIPSMGYDDYDKFLEDLFLFNADKDALVIDVRGNTGGWIHDLLISFLSKKPYAYSTSRRYGAEKRIEPRRMWSKPSIVLVDENSFSDGEIFPTIYQELKLGKVVGFPSSGSVIGTSEYDLIDGSSMRMPGSGWFKLDGTNMEGASAMPDIVVDHSPEDIIANRDLQLNRAVEELMKELKP